MKVRELRELLEEIEDDDLDIVFFTDEDGGSIITEMTLDYYDDEEDDILDNGTAVLVPTEYL